MPDLQETYSDEVTTEDMKLYRFKLKKMVMEKNSWKIEIEFLTDLPDIEMYYGLQFKANVQPFLDSIEEIEKAQDKQPDMFGDYEMKKERVRGEMQKFIDAHPVFETKTAEVWEHKKTEDDTIIIKFKVEDKLVYELSNHRFDLLGDYTINLLRAI